MDAKGKDLDAAQAHPAYQRAIRKAAWYALRGRSVDLYSVYFDGDKMSFLFPDSDERPTRGARRVYSAQLWSGNTLQIRIPGYKSFLYECQDGIVPAVIHHMPVQEGWLIRWQQSKWEIVLVLIFYGIMIAGVVALAKFATYIGL